MNIEKKILDLMNACGENCRNKILNGGHDDVSSVMNYLEVLTISSSWQEAADVVKRIWYKHNPPENI